MKVNYPQTILFKAQGFNDSEAYLNSLCNETFLSLWSYANVFRDQGRIQSGISGAKGDGKELCDLLAIFEEHIFIFSDKRCEFTNSGDIQVDWSRWYKRAVRDAAKQIWGAERWLFKFPNTIYLDNNCTQLFPLIIPAKENAIVHRIIVAHGASKECIKKFRGSGSLMIFSEIIGEMHITTQAHECIPFAIGQENPQKGYVHVFDDVTLEIVMKTLDTISDFAAYISKKEEFIQSGKLLCASGEEDLLAYYLKYINENNEHTFYADDIQNVDKVIIAEGEWDEFCNNPSRKAQAKANQISYAWDELIEKFIFHVTTGTSCFMSHPDIKKQEEMFRFLVRANRTKRRLLSFTIHDLIAKTPVSSRSTRTILPQSPNDPFYVFLLLPKESSIPYEMYREIRRNLLEDYLMITKLLYPNAINIIGLATETGISKERSEDILHLDASNWCDQDYKEAKKIEIDLISNGFLGKRMMSRCTTKEYPKEKPQQIIFGMKGKERNLPCPCGSGIKFKNCCGIS